MTPAEINVAIAQWCGWTNVRRTKVLKGRILREGIWGYAPNTTSDNCLVPDYATSLDAIAQAEAFLRKSDRAVYWQYGKKLDGIVSLYNSDEAKNPEDCISTFEAAALQRSTALLHTVGLWKEEA